MALTPISIVNDADKIRLTFLSIWRITFVRFYHTDTTQILTETFESLLSNAAIGKYYGLFERSSKFKLDELDHCYFLIFNQ